MNTEIENIRNRIVELESQIAEKNEALKWLRGVFGLYKFSDCECSICIALDSGKANRTIDKALSSTCGQRILEENRRMRAVITNALQCVSNLIPYCPENPKDHAGLEYTENVYRLHKILSTSEPDGLLKGEAINLSTNQLNQEK